MLSGMFRPLSLAICLLVAPAVLASGCGSTKTSTTNATTTIPAAAGGGAAGSTGATTSQRATTNAPASKSAPATSSAPASKGFVIPGVSGKEAHHFKEALEVQHQLVAGHLTKQAAKAKREHIERELEAETRPPKTGPETIRLSVPRRLQYPSEVQTKFITGCTTARESTASCECILAKFEETGIEMGQGIAELLYLEARIRLHEPLPRRIQRFVVACKNARA